MLVAAIVSVFLLVAPQAGASAPPPTTQSGPQIQVQCTNVWTGRAGVDYLRPGICLARGAFLETAWGWQYGRYQQLTLAYQEDGNLVLYRWISGQGYGSAIWSSGTNGQPSGLATLQADGNFVLYDASGRPYWSTNTWNCPGNWDFKTLEVQQDENVVLYFWPPGGNTGNRVAKWDAWGNARGC